MPSFELIVTLIFASIFPGTNKRIEWEAELAWETNFPVNPDIAEIVTFLLLDPIGAIKSAPSGLSPFFLSSNRYELTRPDIVLTPMTITSSPGISESTDNFFVEFCGIDTLLVLEPHLV